MAGNKELTKMSIWLRFLSPVREVFVDEQDLAETTNKIGYPLFQTA
jgi:hypothetical protein